MCRLSLRSARSGPPPSACAGGRARWPRRGKGMPRPTRPIAGVHVEKAKLQPQGSKEHPDFILVSPPVDLTESFPQARPVRVILTLPTSIILPPARNFAGVMVARPWLTRCIRRAKAQFPIGSSGRTDCRAAPGDDGTAANCRAAVAPSLPHFVHRIRGPKDGTGTSSGWASTLTAVW